MFELLFVLILWAVAAALILVAVSSRGRKRRLAELRRQYDGLDDED